MHPTATSILLACAALVACGKETNTASPAPTPGAPESAMTKTLEAGAVALQDRAPIEAINAYLNGFHFYNGQPGAQVEAHHYCSIVNEDVTQCVIYDGNRRDARIMGIEYILSARLFATLPEPEKALWHSHVHEVKSGQLFAPGIPEAAEKQLMQKLVGTYGKTWHTWHSERGKELPLGVPQLMMGFTADGQANAAMVAERDRRFGFDSMARRKQREDIPAPAIDPGADAWQKGKVVQIADPTGAHPAQHAAAPASAAAPAASAQAAASAGPR